jgi:hypothetical protein
MILVILVIVDIVSYQSARAHPRLRAVAMHVLRNRARVMLAAWRRS